MNSPKQPGYGPPHNATAEKKEKKKKNANQKHQKPKPQQMEGKMI